MKMFGWLAALVIVLFLAGSAGNSGENEAMSLPAGVTHEVLRPVAGTNGWVAVTMHALSAPVALPAAKHVLPDVRSDGQLRSLLSEEDAIANLMVGDEEDYGVGGKSRRKREQGIFRSDLLNNREQAARFQDVIRDQDSGRLGGGWLGRALDEDERRVRLENVQREAVMEKPASVRGGGTYADPLGARGLLRDSYRAGRSSYDDQDDRDSAAFKLERWKLKNK